MKHKKIIASVASVALFSASMLPANVFADDDYGIVYNGGVPLAEGTVNFNEDLINSLSSLVKGQGATIETTSDNWSGTKWHERYKDSGCYEIKYFVVKNNSTDKHTFSIKNDNYQIDVSINNAKLIGYDGSKDIAVGLDMGNGLLYGSNLMYGDKASCDAGTTSARETGSIVRTSATNRLFFETNIKLKKVGASSPYLAGDDNIYFGLTDFDQSQSFKVLNSGNELSPSNMFAKNVKLLQQDWYYDRIDVDGEKQSKEKENPGPLPATCGNEGITDTKPESPFLNCFKDGYIYSEYNTGSETNDINADLAGSDIFVSLKEATQRDGLNLVFGFAGKAGSGIEYYAKQYTVTYASDENGIIPEDARTSESLIAGDVASGTEEEPKEGYVFKHWIANVDVTLTDGKTIKAGDPITPEEVEKVVVDKDIAFTAIHEEEGGGEPEEDDEDDEDGEGVIAVPDTGASTKNLSAVLIPASIVTILLGALFIRSLPRLMHKKVSFKK